MANLASAMDGAILGQVKPFAQVMAGQQQGQLVNQAAQLDAASKANIYKTQVLSAAAGTGDQNTWINSLHGLAQNGIDVSDVPPDIQRGAAWAQAGRLSQSPLGSLISAGAKLTANDLSAVSTYGSMDAAMKAGYKPEGLSLPNMGSFSAAPTATSPAASPPVASNLTPSGTPDNAPVNYANTAPQPDFITQITPSAKSAATPTAPSPVAPARFNPPAQQPGESIAAYNSRTQQAFEAYKSDPAYVAAQAQASKGGELAATNAENATQSNQMTQRLNQNLDALEKLVPDLPTSNFLDPANKAYLDKRNPFSDQKLATAYSQFQEINQQQMINGLSELVKSGQIRGNQFIEKIISRGYMINPDDPKAAQLADIRNLKAELANINTSSQNIAGGNQSYNPIPVTTAQSAALPKIGTVMSGTDGDYIYKGGDPSNPSSWGKKQ